HPFLAKCRAASKTRGPLKAFPLLVLFHRITVKQKCGSMDGLLGRGVSNSSLTRQLKSSPNHSPHVLLPKTTPTGELPPCEGSDSKSFPNEVMKSKQNRTNA